MRIHKTIHRIGQTVNFVRRGIGHMDRGMRVAKPLNSEVQKQFGGNSITKAAEKGITSYEAVRERIRDAGI
jgi:hypothetical protein